MCNANAFESFLPKEAKPVFNIIGKVLEGATKKKDKKPEFVKVFNKDALEKFEEDKSSRVSKLQNSLNISRNDAKETYLEDIAKKSSSGVKYSENLVDPSSKTLVRLKYSEDSLSKKAKQDISKLEKEYEKNKFLYIKKK